MLDKNIPKNGIIFEYDGIQHFKPVNRFGGEKGFLLTKQNDSIKNNYICIDRLIKILY